MEEQIRLKMSSKSPLKKSVIRRGKSKPYLINSEVYIKENESKNTIRAM